MNRTMWLVCMMCVVSVTQMGCPAYEPEDWNCEHRDPPGAEQVMEHRMEFESLNFDGELPVSRSADGDPAGMLKVSFDVDPSSIGAIPPEHDDCIMLTRETFFSGALTIEHWSDEQTPRLLEVLVDEERIAYSPYTLDIQENMAHGGHQQIGRLERATHTTSYEIRWSYYRGELVLEHVRVEEYGEYADSPERSYLAVGERLP